MPRSERRSRRRERRPGRGRIILVVAAVALFILITTLRSIASFYTDLPVVPLHRPDRRLARRARHEDRPGRRVHRSVLRVDVGEPAHRGPAGAEVPPCWSRRGADRAVSRARRSPAGSAARSVSRPAVRGDRRRRRVRPVERVPAVPEPRLVRRQGPAVRQGRRLLRLPVAVLELGRRLAVRRVRDRVHRHRGRALPERRHPGADAFPAGDAAGQGAPVGAAGRARLGEGGGLLPPAVLTRHVDPRHGRRPDVHGRACAVAGHPACCW